MKTERTFLWLRLLFFLFFILPSVDGLGDSLDRWQARAPFFEGAPVKILYGNGIFIAPGESGAIYTSTDGEEWKERSPGTGQALWDAAYGSGAFVAVGKGGTILTSPDGEKWTRSDSGAHLDLHGVAYGAEIFVAVGNSGLILTSPDGLTWSAKDSGTHQGLKQIAFGDGTFVAVGEKGTILTSADGEAWTERKSSTGGDLKGIAFGRKTFVAVGETILTSSNGAAWTDKGARTNHRFFGIAYGSGVFAAVADNGIIFTSSDGSEWTPRDSGTHLTLYGIAHGKEKFLASGEKGILLQTQPVPSPRISVSSTSLDFGSVSLGESSSTNLTVRNTGTANLIIRQITFSGANTLDFGSRNDTCGGATLAPSQNCTVQIVFSPRSTGSKNATLSIASNDPDTPTQTVSLSGTGTDGAVIVSSGSTGSFCFISTSVQGTGLEGYLDILRKFRDVVLLRSHFGGTLVDSYYRHSPDLARAIERHDFFKKAVALGIVYPLAGFAYVTLHTSPAEKAFLVLLMAGVMLGGWRLMGKSTWPKSFKVRSLISQWLRRGHIINQVNQGDVAYFLNM
ncbi:MAG: choice-of-anchor D domain-containing protein [Syntrophaceae bacterium]|nr:choice-of-anchor D domain-containing protein [Syntrophaceae bacterium]